MPARTRLWGSVCVATLSWITLCSGCRKIDWRSHGAVSPVVNAGDNCGAEPYITLAANLASRWFLAGNKPFVALSAQQILACNTNATGCYLPDSGLNFTNNYIYVEQNGGLVNSSYYPYTGFGGPPQHCIPSKQQPVAASLNGYRFLERGSESGMADEVFHKGPIQASVYGLPWTYYRSGILPKERCGAEAVDAPAFIVGFDECHTPPYWIFQAPYGTSFGEEGYIRIEMGVNACNLTWSPNTALVRPSARA